MTLLTESVAAIDHTGDQLIEKNWDVFISHASEDKEELVRPLARALRQRGFARVVRRVRVAARRQPSPQDR